MLSLSTALAAPNPIETAANATAITVALRYLICPPSLLEVVDVSETELTVGKVQRNCSLEIYDWQYLTT